MNTAPHEVIIKLAVDIANQGPCAKSKRGVVVYEANNSGGVIYGRAFNSPPWPFECNASPACREACRRICIHAEQRAIMQWLSDEYVSRPMGRRAEISLLHVKTVDGKLVPSGDPSCEQCSKFIVESGIHTVWLYVNDGLWLEYSGAGFHQLTLKNLGLPVTL